MNNPIPDRSRVKIELRGVIIYDDGAERSVGVRVPDMSTLYVPRDAIVDILPPVQLAGAKVWVATFSEVMTVVMHDAQTHTYVLRRSKNGGGLITAPDDENVQPHSDVDLPPTPYSGAPFETEAAPMTGPDLPAEEEEIQF